MKENIKKCRERAGYKSPYRAALDLKIDPSYYAKVESGELGPSRTMLIALANGFKCSTDELLGLREVIGDQPADQAAS